MKINIIKNGIGEEFEVFVGRLRLKFDEKNNINSLIELLQTLVS